MFARVQIKNRWRKNSRVRVEYSRLFGAKFTSRKEGKYGGEQRERLEKPYFYIKIKHFAIEIQIDRNRVQLFRNRNIWALIENWHSFISFVE